MGKQDTDVVGQIRRTECGATSSRIEGRFDLIPFAGLLAAARRFEYGAIRHGEGNWQKGDQAFAKERISHMIRHAGLFAEGWKQEDLDALICNAMMIADYKYRGLLNKE